MKEFILKYITIYGGLITIYIIFITISFFSGFKGDLGYKNTILFFSIISIFQSLIILFIYIILFNFIFKIKLNNIIIYNLILLFTLLYVFLEKIFNVDSLIINILCYFLGFILYGYFSKNIKKNNL